MRCAKRMPCDGARERPLTDTCDVSSIAGSWSGAVCAGACAADLASSSAHFSHFF